MKPRVYVCKSLGILVTSSSPVSHDVWKNPVVLVLREYRDAPSHLVSLGTLLQLTSFVPAPLNGSLTSLSVLCSQSH